MPEINLQQQNALFNVAIVVSRFNEEITQGLLQGARERLSERDFTEDHITVVWVPGAVEIPLIAKQLANDNRYEAVICLGAVIQGETKHFDYVCEQVSQGCQRVALDADKPVVFGVLTTDTMDQAQARIGGNFGHKGREAADTAVEMVAMMRQLKHV